MSPIPPITLDPSQTRALLPMSRLIPAVGRAFAESDGTPERVVAHKGDTDWIIMPGLSASGLVCKIISVAPSRKAEGQPTIAGSVFAFDTEGNLVALADAGALTAYRTAAIAGYATEMLANPDAGTLAIFGTGALAGPHVEAIAAVRTLREVRVVGHTPLKAANFASSLQDFGYPAQPATPEEALTGADLVTTVTTAGEPLFLDGLIEPGCHINAMGVYKPDRREIPAPTVGRARIAVEHRATAWKEAGDIIMAMEEGMIEQSDVLADFTEPHALAHVRRTPDDITLFKSVGHVVLDVAAVSVLLQSTDSPERH